MDEGLKIRIGADTTELQKGLGQAEASISKFGSTLKNARGTALTAVPALNSLGQVARDLPFGFIAIQNNLPIVIDQFTNLTRASGGLGPALKGIGSALIGPAGLSFAFGAAIAGVTALIQKYGSLGNAIEELTNGSSDYSRLQKDITEIQKDATKSAGEELAALTTLTTIITDTNNSLDFRKRAIVELRKEYGPYLQNITDEALLTGQATKAINDTTQAILNKSLALAAEKKLAEVGGLILDNQLQQVKATNDLIATRKALAEQVVKANKEGLTNAQGVNTATVFLTTEYDKQISKVNGLTEANKKLFAQFNSIKDLQKTFTENAGIDFFKQIVTPATFVTEILPEVEKVAKLASKATVEKFKSGIDDEIQRNFAVNATVPFQIEVPQKAFDSLKQFGELKKAIFDNEQYKKKAAEFKQILTDSLAQPLGDLFFNFLDKGKIGFKEFADVAIQSIKRIVAQLLASKIISLLSSVLFPATGAAAAVGGKGPFDFLTKLLIPSFSGGGLGGGNMNLTGGIKVEMRGTDLVGVLNRGNAQIGRIG